MTGPWPPVPRLWPGSTVAIVGAGPSATAEQARAAQAGQARVIVVNTSYRLARDADLLYGCDANWWHNVYAQDPFFPGLKVTQDARITTPGVHRIPSEAQDGLSLDPLRIHQGANSGYQALNLAVLLGARRILLLGYDMQIVDGRRHWHGDHPEGLGNPHAGLMQQWRDNFATTLKDLDTAGVAVLNCTLGSALDCFPRARLEDVLG